jgi:NTP pyrophosphatase (non-canonical NTP hydrolase)
MATNKSLDELLMNINELSELIFNNNAQKGFHEKEHNKGERLMLITSELSEALESDRKGKYSKLIFDENHNNLLTQMQTYGINHHYAGEFKKIFENFIKDTHEDEIADAFIRLLDYAYEFKIDLRWHVMMKMKYNMLREYKHGKLY